MVNVCRSCGAKGPKQEHSCRVRCKLCGKGHPTGDKACQQKYQTPLCRSTEAKRTRDGTCIQRGPGRFPNARGRAAWAVFWRLAAAFHHGRRTRASRFPLLRNGPPRKRIENF
ncbi:hypothetical protein HPB49_005770 [Dermacentor silvarum]|uniref:Uncharacterized protein n=1 Tax=Dermacentor silvarum TaxID=543639 RepID=A0ACB8DMV3_DERSI|nr:hypothetical protein HPB49_005770 [Dermacentor silvarum]